uniref:Novel peptide 3 n=1 Tax=Pithecopus azureus TaxID=2034991 RepID=NOVP3_PITAZ|nr:RecName: Full=Novel peptide 3; AltName: Full=TRP-HA1 [Pithecopus azureus]
VMYYSLPRPV